MAVALSIFDSHEVRGNSPPLPVGSSEKGRWADEVDENQDADEQLCYESPVRTDVREMSHATGNANIDSSARRNRGGVNRIRPAPSAGSVNHDKGCKPCAFFYTKGCKSGEDCLFCHLCPAHEKARRKRLKRIQVWGHAAYENGRHRAYKERGDMGKREQFGRAEHTRVRSGSSVTTAASTWMSSAEGHHHSRQWSNSTQEALEENTNGQQVSEGLGTDTTVTVGALEGNAQPCVFVPVTTRCTNEFGETNELACMSGFGGTSEIGSITDFGGNSNFGSSTDFCALVPVAAPMLTYDGVSYTLMPVPPDGQSGWDMQQVMPQPVMAPVVGWW